MDFSVVAVALQMGRVLCFLVAHQCDHWGLYREIDRGQEGDELITETEMSGCCTAASEDRGRGCEPRDVRHATQRLQSTREEFLPCGLLRHGTPAEPLPWLWKSTLEYSRSLRMPLNLW